MEPEPRYARPRGTPTLTAVLAAAAGVLLAALATLGGVQHPAQLLGHALAGDLGCAALLVYMGRTGGRLAWRRSQVTAVVWLALALTVTRLLAPQLPHPAWLPLGAAFLPMARHLDRRVTALAATALAAALLATPLLAALAWAQGLWVAARPGPPRRSAWRWAPRLGLELLAVSLVAATVVTLLVAPTQLVDPGLGLAHPLVAAAASATGSLALGLALGPVMERAMGQLSRAALLELSDLDNPLLQRIATRAPGTWQHSRSMANLAESAAGAVGADALLVRVGAYYHDLGKADEPQFFVENASPGAPSPHDALTPEQSAARILAHVREGVRRGRAAGLPEEIIDFMHTHHGSSRVEYFWQRAKDRARAEGTPPPDEAAFTYPGARPHSRETGILALVDAVEAAARTLERPTRRDVERLVRQIVFTKLAAGQLDVSGLSASDLRRVGESLIQSLLAQAHERVRYPWQEQEDAPAATSLAADASDAHLPPAADASAPDLRLVDGATRAPPPREP